MEGFSAGRERDRRRDSVWRVQRRIAPFPFSPLPVLPVLPVGNLPPLPLLTAPTSNPAAAARIAAMLRWMRMQSPRFAASCQFRPLCFFALLVGVLHAGGVSAASVPSPVLGVNIGGWLVLEPWIKPSMFEVPLQAGQQQPYDEWTLGEYLGDRVDQYMKAHYNTWLLRSDLETAYEAGINSVRIPVGYWIVDRRPDEPYASPEVGWPFLTRALDWCKEIGLVVQIDIHGLPGSQNGLDHSGRRGEIRWTEPENLARSLEVVRKLTQQLSDQGYLAPSGPVNMLQPVNEPWMSIDLGLLLDWYNSSYHVIRAIAPAEHVAIAYSDSFRLPDPVFENFMPEEEGYENVYLDEHFYQIFDLNGLSMSRDQHLVSTQSFFRDQQRNHLSKGRTKLLVGEFTLATTDCAKWLTGVNQGYRWDGTKLYEPNPPYGNCSGDDGNDPAQFSSEYRAFLRGYSAALFDTFENTLNVSDGDDSLPNLAAGWYFWTLKTEGAPQWDLLLGLREGWIPRPVSTRASISRPTPEPTPGGDNSTDGDVDGDVAAATRHAAVSSTASWVALLAAVALTALAGR